MTALLTDNLPLLAGAPNGIKKLRELILELAVRGKLVPQDPSDEPAGALLKRVAEEKSRLVAEGKIKKQKTLEEIATEECPFVLPAGWEWTRLGNVSAYIQRGKGPAYVDQSDFRVVSQKCVRWTGLDLQPARFIEPESLVKYEPIRFLRSGDILWNSTGTGTIGRACIVEHRSEDEQLVADSHVTVVRPTSISPVFLWRWIQSPSVQRELEGNASGTTNQIELNTSTVIAHLTPIPPLAEQHRIVAKVDELMALCDRLEAQQADAESAHAQLVQALLGSLTQAADAEEFAASWQLLAEHFRTLFTTESSIDALKQTLLQLAVMGKLVPQAPSDEPASELLKRVAEKKARLISEEGLRTTAREDVPETEHYFTLHAGWVPSRLGNIARFIDYRGRTPTKTSSGVPLITAKNVRPGFISREPQEFIADTDYLSWMTRGFPRVGDMLFTTEAPMGNVAIIDITDQFALAQRVICFQLHELEIGPFLKLVMMSSGFQAQLSDAATGMTATGIKSSRLKEIPVPIPPLPEQHRIVAKVEQLMSLCDSLKARLADAEKLNKQLAAALVEQAVA